MKPNNETKKALAIASILGAIIKSWCNGNPRLIGLGLQVDKAMRVFSSKAPMTYYDVSDKVAVIWGELAEEHTNSVDSDELEVFISMIAHLIPHTHYKMFLGVSTFKTVRTLRDTLKSGILMSVLELDRKLNDVLGTTSTIDRDALGRVMVKVLKQPKAKPRRDVAVPLRTKKLRKRLAWHKARRNLTQS